MYLTFLEATVEIARFKGFPSSITVCTVMGARQFNLHDRELLMILCIARKDFGQSASISRVSMLKSRSTPRNSLQTDSNVLFDHVK